MNTQNTTSQHTADLSFMSNVYDHGPDMIHGNPCNIIMSEHGEVCRVPHYMHESGVTARIVHCVNQHDANLARIARLEAALERIASGITPTSNSVLEAKQCVKQYKAIARAALAKG